MIKKIGLTLAVFTFGAVGVLAAGDFSTYENNGVAAVETVGLQPSPWSVNSQYAGLQPSPWSVKQQYAGLQPSPWSVNGQFAGLQPNPWSVSSQVFTAGIQPNAWSKA